MPIIQRTPLRLSSPVSTLCFFRSSALARLCWRQRFGASRRFQRGNHSQRFIQCGNECCVACNEGLPGKLVTLASAFGCQVQALGRNGQRVFFTLDRNLPFERTVEFGRHDGCLGTFGLPPAGMCRFAPAGAISSGESLPGLLTAGLTGYFCSKSTRQGLSSAAGSEAVIHVFQSFGSMMIGMRSCTSWVNGLGSPTMMVKQICTSLSGGACSQRPANASNDKSRVVK